MSRIKVQWCMKSNIIVEMFWRTFIWKVHSETFRKLFPKHNQLQKKLSQIVRVNKERVLWVVKTQAPGTMSKDILWFHNPQTLQCWVPAIAEAWPGLCIGKSLWSGSCWFRWHCEKSIIHQAGSGYTPFLVYAWLKTQNEALPQKCYENSKQALCYIVTKCPS